MATFNRGRHILPSVESVLRQSFRDFELIVVGDACTDDSSQLIRDTYGQSVRWINLERRIGSQSGPNNAGIAASRGRHISYIGHDDIWAPGHLQALHDVFQAMPESDFAVSGAIFHTPPGVPWVQVTGLFQDSDAAFIHFFPPSSFSHKRTVIERIGPWQLPMEIRSPVDCDFLLRAAHAGLRFRSTGRITVHKFAAGHRYLSYLHHESHEQMEMLSMTEQPDYGLFVEATRQRSIRTNQFMTVRYYDFDALAPGQLAKAAAASKGLRNSAPARLKRKTVMVEPADAMALDWEARPDDGWRRVGFASEPRILIPFCGSGRALVGILFFHERLEALQTVRIRHEGTERNIIMGKARMAGHGHCAVAEFDIELKPDDSTVLQLVLDDRQRKGEDHAGLAYGMIMLDPWVPARRRQRFPREFSNFLLYRRNKATVDALLSRAPAIIRQCMAHFGFR